MYKIFFSFLFWCVVCSPVQAQTMSAVSETVYPELEHLLTLPCGAASITQTDVEHLVNLVRSTASGTSLTMQDRNKATGAAHTFAVHTDLATLVSYVYNPAIPAYVTMPSSVRDQQWLTKDTTSALHRLPQAIQAREPFWVRGSEQETITPDANTGGYYAYRQDRLIAYMPMGQEDVLVSVSVQPDASDVGRKGCVIGEDGNWNYLYSEEPGLTKTGLGWVDSYMYYAASVLVFVADPQTKTVRAGSFKWLNAGWAGMNMVKQGHILNGIKRFASDFISVLESATMPGPQELATLRQTLLATDENRLREDVTPYLEAMRASGDAAVNSAPFKTLLASGEYLRTMSKQEMVKVLVHEFMKKHLGRDAVLQVAKNP
ncbi:hypothetical protein MASR1M90_15470 [Desulfovibrionales bacterium]